MKLNWLFATHIQYLSIVGSLARCPSKSDSAKNVEKMCVHLTVCKQPQYDRNNITTFNARNSPTKVKSEIIIIIIQREKSKSPMLVIDQPIFKSLSLCNRTKTKNNLNCIAPIVGVRRTCDDDDDRNDYYFHMNFIRKKYNGNRKRWSSIDFTFKPPNAICWMLMIMNMIADRWSLIADHN